MAGMHRDKCGAAAVAGFFQVTCFFKNLHNCFASISLQHSKSLSPYVDFSQVEAKTSEGCWLHGHGEEQRGTRSV